MKKLLVYALVLLGGIYGVGYFSCGEGGVERFLNKSQALTSQGDAQGLCDQLADDVQVNIVDHTVEVDRRLGNGKFSGGKADFCARIQATVPAMTTPGISMQVQRNDLQVKRQAWLHPWTAEVTYNEKYTTNIQAAGKSLTIKTESDDKMLLVMTLGGVKIKRLESEAWLQ